MKFYNLKTKTRKTNKELDFFVNDFIRLCKRYSMIPKVSSKNPLIIQDSDLKQLKKLKSYVYDDLKDIKEDEDDDDTLDNQKPV